jgi:formylglycine-generating enzyme required for sulfatase activity
LRLHGYRLPTEVEWEYACRAGSTVGYSFGEPAELLEKYGWFVGNSLSKSHPCGTLKPNDFGLFDMHGNVWQWTHDKANWRLEGKEDDSGELIAEASSRATRCGGWRDDAGVCRAAYRSAIRTGGGGIDDGFRIARVPVEAGGK